MKVTLSMPYEGHEPDETIDVEGRTGRDLIRFGWARLPDEPVRLGADDYRDEVVLTEGEIAPDLLESDQD